MTSLFKERRDHHGRGVQAHVKRFTNPKVFGTGVDPVGSYLEFVKHDVVRNIDMHRDTIKRVDNLEARKDLPAIGCTKRFQSKSVSGKREPVPYTLKTDIISFRRPENTVQQPTAVADKPRFSKSVTTEGWSAQRPGATLNNCQSTGYNIINFQENPHAVLRKTTNINAKKQKGITEYADLMALFSNNVNKAYVSTVESDPTAFKRKTGIFTHMYDAAARHGNIIMPFEKAQDFGGKPAFKL